VGAAPPRRGSPPAPHPNTLGFSYKVTIKMTKEYLKIVCFIRFGL
jgi:hypothetical protein